MVGLVGLFGLSALDGCTKVINKFVHVLDTVESYVALHLITSLRPYEGYINVLCQLAVFNTVCVLQADCFDSLRKGTACDGHRIFADRDSETPSYQYTVDYPPAKGCYSEPPPCSDRYVKVPTPVSLILSRHIVPSIKNLMHTSSITLQGALS